MMSFIQRYVVGGGKAMRAEKVQCGALLISSGGR